MIRNDDTLLFGLVLFFTLLLGLYLYLAANPGPLTLRAITIDMSDTPDDQGRDIPRPRQRRQDPAPVKAAPMRPSPMPLAPPMLAQAPSEDAMAVPMVPDMDQAPTAPSSPAGVSANAADAMAGFMTKQDYFELLKMRVEALKQYPKEAKAQERQGEVVVLFVIAEDGQVSDVSVQRSSGVDSLDRAALKAVRQASPFPRPPAGLFSYPLRLQVAVQFMLT